MYRIMIAKSKKSNYETLYQYLTTTTDGVVSPKEFSDADSVDAYVETMLNDNGYAKDDFIIVKVIDFTIDATGYSGIDEEDEDEDDSSDDTDSETDDSTTE